MRNVRSMVYNGLQYVDFAEQDSILLRSIVPVYSDVVISRAVSLHCKPLYGVFLERLRLAVVVGEILLGLWSDVRRRQEG